MNGSPSIARKTREEGWQARLVHLPATANPYPVDKTVGNSAWWSHYNWKQGWVACNELSNEDRELERENQRAEAAKSRGGGGSSGS